MILSKELSKVSVIMNNLVIKTASKVIYMLGNKVLCVRDALTGRFVKICPFLKVQALNFVKALLNVTFNTAKFSNFQNTIMKKKMLNAANNTMKAVIINGQSLRDFIKEQCKITSDYMKKQIDYLA